MCSSPTGDLDVLDPIAAPGPGTPEAHLAMELLAKRGTIGSLELVEVNPILDVSTSVPGTDVLIPDRREDNLSPVRRTGGP